MKMKIVLLILIVFAGLSILLLTVYGAFSNWPFKKSYVCRDCNVILISVDTLRADHLGILGYSRGTSPNIDNFFGNGLVFSKHFSQSSNTLPSHMSMFTSLYPQEHGVMLLTNPRLSSNVKTLAEIMRENGYATVGFYTGSSYLDPKFGFDRGFDSYRVSGRDLDSALGQDPISGRDLDPTSGRKIESALNVLDEFSKNKKKFFMFLHPDNPHDPYDVEDIYAKKFVDPNYKGKIDSNPESYKKYQDSSWRVYSDAFWATVDKNSREDIKHLVDLYDAEILRTDEKLGKLFAKLEESHLSDNTIVILTADHGEQFYEHGAFRHARLFDEIIHIPLLVKNPKIEKKINTEALTQNIDIAPTVLDFLGISQSPNFSGKSLVPLIKGESGDINLFTISQWSQQTAIRTEEWKLILEKGENKQLFDLVSDLAEKKNLVKKNQNIVKDLEDQLLGVLGEVRFEFPEATNSSNIDDATRQKLIKEGYF